MGNEHSLPVAAVSNPYEAGAGDQDRWSSCAVFALSSTLSWKLGHDFRLDIDTQGTADGMLTRGLKNRRGTLIIDEGVDIPWLVDLMNQHELMVKTKEYSWAKVSFVISADRGVEHDGTIEKGFPGTFGGDALVVAGGFAGTHENHALHVDKVEYEPALKVVCDNSWGSTLPNPVVPGPQWTHILRFYRIRVEKIEVKIKTQWVEVFAGGFLCGTRLVVQGCVKASTGGHYDYEVPRGTRVQVVSKPGSCSHINNDTMLYFKLPDGRIAWATEWYSFAKV